MAKVPDVWGQARLTQYRDEFESVMEAQKGNFQETLQGSLARQDQAYLLSATSIAAAAGGPKAFTTTPAGVADGGKVSSQPTMQVLNAPPAPSLFGLTQTTDKDGKTTEVKLADINSTPFAATNLKFSDAFRTSVKGADGKTSQLAISLEPTVVLAQQKRYLDFLAQLRRENEGDDTADSPGYSLNLLRIPVSVLPGKRTDVGFGAEVTMTLTPVLGDDLLPMTFRNLIINDLVNQLGYPLTQVLDGEDFDDILTPELKLVIEGSNLILKWAPLGVTDPEAVRKLVAALSDRDKERVRVAVNNQLEEGTTVPEARKDPEDIRLRDALILVLKYHSAMAGRAGQRMGCDTLLPASAPVPAEVKPVTQTAFTQPPAAPPVNPKGPATESVIPRVKPGASLYAPLTSQADAVGGPVGPRPTGPRPRGAAATTPATTGQPPPTPQQVQQALRLALDKLRVPSLSFSNGLDNRTAVPTSQLFDVYGEANLFAVGFGAHRALNQAFVDQGYAHLPDVQSFLREELRAAYQFLARPENQSLWSEFCTPDLVAAVRNRQLAILQDRRDAFRCRVEAISLTDQYRLSRPDNELMQFSTTAALAWCLIVDAALLNDRLIRDMRETATSKNQPLPGCDPGCAYFLPDPPAECRRAFNAYVAVRWPIRVFALDPVTQEQNLADRLSTRRELQLALSLAFSSGKINFNQLTRYARRLEAEYETIELNRTQVGFGHGENTFGWRFYPRFQSPDTPGNLTVIGRDLFLGGPNRNQLLRQRRLEPGMRECVAVVAMPSFVPYLTVDTASNWFPLTNPKHKVLDTAQAVKLSRTVQAVKTDGCEVRDARKYRPGEHDRLVKRAEQLEARLPLQTLTTPVPILNTYGGFEMFANGTTDLAPQLFGWYGAPGIDPEADTTTLFLVGDHFSPLRTQTIVGNQEVSKGNQRLLSRQVMKVSFAKGAYPLTDEGGRPATVRVHVATPYGVTRELDIPVAKAKLKTPDPTPAAAGPKAGFTFGDAKLTARYVRQQVVGPAGVVDKLFVAASCPESGNDDGVKIGWLAPGGTLTKKVELTFTFKFQNVTLPCTCTVSAEVKGKTVVIPKAEADRLAAELVNQIGAIRPLSIDANPLDEKLKSEKVTIRPVTDDKSVPQAAETNDQLTVEFKPVACCPPGDCPQRLPDPKPVPKVEEKSKEKKDEKEKP